MVKYEKFILEEKSYKFNIIYNYILSELRKNNEKSLKKIEDILDTLYDK